MQQQNHDWLIYTLEDLSKYMEDAGLDAPRGDIELAILSLERCLGKPDTWTDTRNIRIQ